MVSPESAYFFSSFLPPSAHSRYYIPNLTLLQTSHSSYADHEVQSAGAGAGAGVAVLFVGGAAATTPFEDHAEMGAPRRIAACSIS